MFVHSLLFFVGSFAFISSAAAEDLPDVTKKLSKGLCSNGPGAEGADSYFSGTFTIDGNTVTGTERWILYANPKWKAKGGKSCILEWNFTGTISDKGRCTSCELGIQFHAVADVNGSNCPEELVLGRLLPDGRRAGGEGQDFDNKYAIKKGSNGTTKVYFGKSGKLTFPGKGFRDLKNIESFIRRIFSTFGIHT